MPTNRGWALAGASLALVALWWLFGDEELLLVGIVAGGAVVAALAWVRVSRPVLAMSRRLAAPVVSNGDVTTIELRLVNRGRAPIPAIEAVDEVHGLGQARFELARLRRGGEARAAYRVLCRPRGVYAVGPSHAHVQDPLGLAAVQAGPGPVDRLVVYPAVEELAGFPGVRGHDPAVSAARPEHSQRGGEDFYTLREYQRGDDLRRVHWPSSARTQELMIRQLETPWQSRALVLLDVRQGSYESRAAFETAVSGAASVVTHLVGSGFDTDIWAGEGQVVDASAYETTMEMLSLVQPDPAIDIESVATRLRRKGGGGALIMVTGSADRPLLSVQRLLANDYPVAVLLGCSSTTSQILVGFHRSGTPTIVVEPGSAWAEPWQRAMRETWTGVSAS